MPIGGNEIPRDRLRTQYLSGQRSETAIPEPPISPYIVAAESLIRANTPSRELVRKVFRALDATYPDTTNPTHALGSDQTHTIRLTRHQSNDAVILSVSRFIRTPDAAIFDTNLGLFLLSSIGDFAHHPATLRGDRVLIGQPDAVNDPKNRALYNNAPVAYKKLEGVILPFLDTQTYTLANQQT